MPSMEDEIKHELTLSPEQNANLQEQIKNYDMNIGNDHTHRMDETIEEINARSKVDGALYQGDMILTKAQADEIIEDIKGKKGDRKRRQAYRDYFYPQTLWQNGVYYSFYHNATRDMRTVTKIAAKIWQEKTCINITESDTALDRIIIFKEVGCWSYVGRTGGVQGLSLGRGCDTVGTAAHELGHALGFFHTQSRHDREDFITLYLENFWSDWISQFKKQSESTNYNYNLTYDYGSVIHYGAKGVSRNGKPVMITRDINYMPTLGSPMISFYDKLMMNLHTNALTDALEAPLQRVKMAGFPIQGTALDAVALPDMVDDFAMKEYKTFPNTGNIWSGINTKEVFMKAPEGSTIEVVLDRVDGDIEIEGCRYGGVEIKTGSDIRRTGYRFCGPSHSGTKLTSTHSTVPVITYNLVYSVYTVLRYRIASSGSRTTKTKPQSTAGPTLGPSPKPNCIVSNVCTALMKWDFCTSPKYNEKIRRQVCPKSCNLC